MNALPIVPTPGETLHCAVLRPIPAFELPKFIHAEAIISQCRTRFLKAKTQNVRFINQLLSVVFEHFLLFKSEHRESFRLLRVQQFAVLPPLIANLVRFTFLWGKDPPSLSIRVNSQYVRVKP